MPEGDLTWMAELPRYDTWDPGASGPYARWLAANPDAPEISAPLPDYAMWQYVARARLLQGRAHGDLPAALGEVRALAGLLWSSEALVGELVALVLVGYERNAVEDAVANGVDVGGFTPVSEEDEEAFRRYTLALVMVYRGAAPDALARLEQEIPDFSGRCGAIPEAMRQAGLTRDFFERTWPGEIALAGRYPALDAAARDTRCHLHHVGAAWRGETKALGVLALHDDEVAAEAPPGLLPLVRVPWARQAVAAWLEVIMSRPAFNRYRRPT